MRKKAKVLVKYLIKVVRKFEKSRRDKETASLYLDLKKENTRAVLVILKCWGEDKGTEKIATCQCLLRVRYWKIVSFERNWKTQGHHNVPDFKPFHGGKSIKLIFEIDERRELKVKIYRQAIIKW